MRKSNNHSSTTGSPAERICDWPRCALPGEFRAPKDRSPATGFWWFCLQHIRRYNANWDYFRGMSEAEIDDFRDSSQTWHRPTWQLGSQREKREWRDPFGFSGVGPSFRGNHAPGPLTRPLRRKDILALRTLGLDESSSSEQVRKQYARLVKLYHPDTNEGDNSCANRLRAVVEAYNHLAKYLPRTNI